MKKRLVSGLLTVCMAAALLVIPVQGASASENFRDIQDPATAAAAESMRLMGVVDGYGDGTFRPGTVLSRAQFCKMAICAMNGTRELGRYETVTVFPDVKPSHWAAGYVNMASKGKGIIAGFADGRFHPGDPATVGQAVTILMRSLGYKDEEIGGVWPDSYLAAAASIGLTEGVRAAGAAPITRGDAVTLFLNFLRADLAEGGSYAASLGTTVENVMLLSSNAKGSKGLENGLEITGGMVYQLAGGKKSSGILDGRKGTLLLNSAGEVLTFLPDAVGSSQTVTVSSAQEKRLTDLKGRVYAIGEDVKVYRNGEETTWSEAYLWLNAGTSVTLYLGAGGSVEFVFIGGSSTASEAVIVEKDGSSAGLDALSGGRGDYRIVKNGLEVGGGDLRRWDVATYTPATNTIHICDTRITGFYENCKPSPREPSEITVMGHPFQVLPTAAQTLSAFAPGDQMTLLLTEDNQVAGALKAAGTAGRGNALGIVKELSGSSATVNLLCGISVTGAVKMDVNTVAALKGQLVNVSSTKSGLALTRMIGGVSGDLDAGAGTLGKKPLAENVMIFRQGKDGLVSIGRNELGSQRIPNQQILYAGTDWADRVKIVVLGDAQESGAYYGRVIVVKDKSTEAETVEIECGEGISVGPVEKHHDVRNGDYVRVIMNREGTGFTSLQKLERLKNVPNGAWSSPGAVTVNGRTYQVSADVSCYNRETRRWVSLAEARAYAQEANLYVREGLVRVIEIG